MSVSNNPNSLPNVNTQIQTTWVKGFRTGKKQWINGSSPSRKTVQVGSDAHVSAERSIDDQKTNEIRENTLPKAESPPQEQKISRGVKLLNKFNTGLSNLADKVSSFFSKMFQSITKKPEDKIASQQPTGKSVRFADQQPTGKSVRFADQQPTGKSVRFADQQPTGKSVRFADQQQLEKSVSEPKVVEQSPEKALKEVKKAVSRLIEGKKDKLDFGKALSAAVEGQTPLFKRVLFDMITENAKVQDPTKSLRKETEYKRSHLKDDQQVIDFLKLAKEVTTPDEFNEVLSNLNEGVLSDQVIDSVLVDKQGILKPDAFSILNFHLEKEFKIPSKSPDSFLRSNNIASKLLSRYIKNAGKETISALLNGVIDSPKEGGSLNIKKDSYPLSQKVTKEVADTWKAYDIKDQIRQQAIPPSKEILDRLDKMIEGDQIPKSLLDALHLLHELSVKYNLDKDKFKNFEFTTFFLRNLCPVISSIAMAEEHRNTPFSQLAVEVGSDLQMGANFDLTIEKRTDLSPETKKEVSILRENSTSIAQKLDQKLQNHQR